jgi:hypothetical protein
VFTGDGYTGEAHEYGCEAAVVAPVLDVHKEAMAEMPLERKYADVLMGGFELNYSPHSEQCGICERSGGWCGYQHNQNGSLGFTCFCNGGPTTDKCGTCAFSTRLSSLLEVLLLSDHDLLRLLSMSLVRCFCLGLMLPRATPGSKC